MLDLYWRWGTKAWGANGIRYPGSPRPKRWELGVREIRPSWAPKLTREVDRLGSTVARLKLKGIGGDPHKRWNMWFNSTVSEEPYQGLTSRESPGNRTVPLWNSVTGAAWLSSARALRCSLKCVNERNPCRMLNCSYETACLRWEEGKDDVKSAWPLCLGRHTCYNGRYNG